MLDVKDKKIIAELLLNSRISFTQLAKKVGVSREVAQYRVKKLEQDKVILQYYLVLDYTSLGFKLHNFIMQLKGVTETQENDILKFLVGHKNVTYLSPIVGKWNFAFDILAKDDADLNRIVVEITERINPHLASFVVYHGALEGESFPTKFVGITKIAEPTTSNKQMIDNLDKKILQVLATNARAEYKQLSADLKTPANTIAFRIKRLQKNRIIKSSTISIDYKKLGWDVYNIQIRANTTKTDKIVAFAKQHPQAWYYFRYVGNAQWDIDVGLLTKNTHDLRTFLLELKQFPEVSHIHDVYLIERIAKDNIAPAAVFE